MKDTIIDRVTYGVAGAGITLHAWLPPLKDISETAALVLPILGVAWLIVQIITKILGR